MAAEFVVRNAYGRVQFDAVSPVMSLQANLGGGDSWSPDGGPQLLVRTPAPGNPCAPGIGGGTNLLFGRPTAVAAPGQPTVEIRDSINRLTYSSAQLPMRVAGTLVGSVGQAFAADAARTYGAVFPSFLGGDGWRLTNTILVGGNYEYTDEEWYEHYQWVNAISSDGPGSLYVDRIVTGADGYGTRQDQPPDNDFVGTLLIVDVTNYF